MTTRRQFLKRSGGILTIGVGGLQIACSIEQTKQIDSASLDDEAILSLVRIFQHILPHSDLDTQVYIDAVTTLTQRTSNNPVFRKELEDGLSGLNSETAWLDLTANEQVNALKAIEKSRFFIALQTTALEQLYRDGRTWELVGYEGEAIKFGGYVNRGFNDIDWLPEPPTAGGSN
jgi:hypothetical protein